MFVYIHEHACFASVDASVCAFFYTSSVDSTCMCEDANIFEKKKNAR